MNQTTGTESTTGRTPDVREQFNAAGNQAANTIRHLVEEGNVRSIVVRHDGRTVVSIPVTVGVIGTILAPQVAVLGLLAAVLTQSTIEVVRTGPPAPPQM
jgi:hypothetical protein